MRRLATLLLAAATPACITIATSYGTPTALERQLLGVYEELDRDLILASSVRGDVLGAPGSFESIKALAIEGRALQRFNEDDLGELKTNGCIAEMLDTTVKALPCPLTEAKDDNGARWQRTLERVVGEENRARRNILTWAAHAYARSDGRQSPTQKDVAEILRTYHRLLREAAAKGHRFQSERGAVEAI